MLPQAPQAQNRFGRLKHFEIKLSYKITKILNTNKKIKIFYTKYKAQNISDFKTERVTAFAGIGMPENFFNLLEDNNINIINKIKFPDHHKYSHKELENLVLEKKENNAKGKIKPFSLAYNPGATNFHIWYVITGTEKIIPPISAIVHLITNIP